MALIGEMQYLTIGENTYSLPVGGGGTVTSVAVSNATNGGLSISGSPISSSGTITIGHSNVLTAAQTTSAVYPIKIDKNGHISEYGSAITIPSISLNGSATTSPSFYAPTSAGTDGYFLKSNGSGAPTWASVPAGVTVTLNGSSTTTPSFYAPYTAGTSGYVLKSSGSGAPTWTSAILTDQRLKTELITDGSGYLILGNGSTAAETKKYSSAFEAKVDSSDDEALLCIGTTSLLGNLVFGNGTNTYITTIYPTATSSPSLIALPDASGTVALISDIPTVPTKVSDLTNDSGFITLTDVPEEVFVVTITYSNNEYSFNKTYAQIIAAYNAGKHIVGHDISFNNYYYITNVYEHSTQGQITFSNFISVNEPFSSEYPGHVVCNVIYIDSSNHIASEACQLAVPTRTSHLTNDSGFITTETDPIFGASAAAGITSADITSWNNKISDDKTWNGVTLNKGSNYNNNGSVYIPYMDNYNSTTAYTGVASATPSQGHIVKWDVNSYLYSTTPSANDNSTKVATTAYVDNALSGVTTTAAQIIRWTESV